MQRPNYPSPVTSQVSPHLYINAFTSTSYSDPRSQIIPPCDAFYYAPPHYPSVYPQYPGYRPAGPGRHYVLTPYNYPPYQSGYLYGPAPRERYLQGLEERSMLPGRLEEADFSVHNECLAQQKLLFHRALASNVINSYDDKSRRVDTESCGSFEYTVQPEQIVRSICDEESRSRDALQNRARDSVEPWIDQDVMQPLRLEDDELTKFIVDGCARAEGIAVRNQHRPCFKNIRHLCNRTRADILKPRTTVANIHSQGIPWATKDFIFAFVRLVNCWYILKGYLEDHEGSLGKIETALTPELKECYQRWQTTNRELIRYLIDVFVNLDTGVTVQNAEIFSSFNQTIIPNNPNTAVSQEDEQECDKHRCLSEIPLHSIKEREGRLKRSNSEVNVPGILRVKDVFSLKDEDLHTQVYMKPGSYRVPKKRNEDVKIDEDNEEVSKEKNNLNALNEDAPTDPWMSALESIGPFMKTVLQNNDKCCTYEESKDLEATVTKDKYAIDVDSHVSIVSDIQNWVNKQDFEHSDIEDESDTNKDTLRNESNPFQYSNFDIGFKCREHRSESSLLDKNVSGTRHDPKTDIVYSNVCFWSKRQFGLSPVVVGKFENIIRILWQLQFAKYIAFEVNAETVPDYFKFITKPVFLYNIMNNLKENKYRHPHQVVHDLRSIVRNSEIYIENRPDWWFEKCLTSFKKELEDQLKKQFSSFDFSSITGDPNETLSHEQFDKSNNLADLISKGAIFRDS